MRIGAYAIEQDYSQYITHAAKTVLAILGTASKGPIGEAVVCTSTQDLVNKFGPLSPEHYGLYAAAYFLGQSSKLYYVRVTDPDTMTEASAIAVRDDESTATITALKKGTLYNGYKVSLNVIYPDGDDGNYYYDITVKSDSGEEIESIKHVDSTALVGNVYNTEHVSIKINLAEGAGPESFLEVELSGGSDGNITDTTTTTAEGTDLSEIYEKYVKVLSPESVDINLIATPGISDINAITSMISFAESKGDCLYLVDPPKPTDDELLNLKGRDDNVIVWHNKKDKQLNALMIDSSYGALYYDWQYIYDSYNKKRVMVPPSVVVAATYAYSDKVADVWFAPAGLTRGKIKGVIEPVNVLSKADAEKLYSSPNAINPIYTDPQAGLVIWGQKTLQRDKTALDRVNVRRLLNYLKRVVTATCNYLTFEPNDRVTWNSFKMKVDPILQGIQTKRGIYEYRIVHGESIVTDNDIDNYRMPCMILIRPTKTAEEIPIYFAITSTGADFNDVLDASGLVIQE